MDITSANPGAFLSSEEGSALMEEEMDLDGNDDMELTEALRGNLAHKRSLSGRQPFAPIRVRDSIAFPSDDAIPSDDDDDGDQTQSILEDDSQVQSEVENSQEGMEFTVPMGQSLKPPATEDPVWLALRQVTHSGDTPHEPQASSEDDIQVANGQQGMDLNDAMTRLMRARDSLGERTEDATEDMDITTANGNFATRADSFSSSDDSLNEDLGEGDETLNVSKVIGRLSLGRFSGMSLGFQDSTMDESGIYGSVVPLSSSTPRQSTAPPPEKDKLTPDLPDDLPDFPETPESERVEATRPPVFQSLTNETNIRLSPSNPPSTMPATETERPPKSPVFRFIPPPPPPNSTALPPSQSPARPVSPVKVKPKPSFSAAFAPPVTKRSPKKSSASSTPVNGSANKRRFSVMHDGAPDSGRSSPAKRPTLGPKSVVAPSPNKRSAPSPGKNSTQKNSNALSVPPKRQSGYFAQRKSLGNVLSVPTDGRGKSLTPTPSSHRENASGGRASLGSTQSENWVGFDKNVPAPVVRTIVLTTGQSQLEEARQQPVPQPIPDPNAAPTPVSDISPGPVTIPLGWMVPVTGGREEGNDVREATTKSGAEPPQTPPAEDFVSLFILNS
jgi:kinetochore protein Spc7/SPC105